MHCIDVLVDVSSLHFVMVLTRIVCARCLVLSLCSNLIESALGLPRMVCGMQRECYYYPRQYANGAKEYETGDYNARMGNEIIPIWSMWIGEAL